MSSMDRLSLKAEESDLFESMFFSNSDSGAVFSVPVPQWQRAVADNVLDPKQVTKVKDIGQQGKNFIRQTRHMQAIEAVYEQRMEIFNSAGQTAGWTSPFRYTNEVVCAGYIAHHERSRTSLEQYTD